ncbi:hypothetical protein PQX77_017462 [Marasmius sp. AFHP31]|nr:hypothetical protein PQX77_017462 [Marasmius sp. AFHP31]
MVTITQKETDHQDALPQIDGPNADIIIRTSDEVDFQVHSSILSDASPFFRLILDGPTSPPRYSGTLDRIPVPEKSQTFGHLLRCMYPGMIHTRPSGWGETKSLFEAFLKYEMDGSDSFKKVVESLLDTSKQLPEQYGSIDHAGHAASVLRVYATIWAHRVKLGQHYVVHKILQGLAIRALQIPFHELTAATTPELDDLPASQLTKLFAWVQQVKMSVHSPSFAGWDEKDVRFEYPCATLTAQFSKPGADVASLMGKDGSIPQGLIPKTRLLKWYKGIFVPSFNDRRNTIVLAPELWACESCESFEAETVKPCFEAMARRIRRICRREMGLALAASVGLQGVTTAMKERFQPFGESVV